MKKSELRALLAVTVIAVPLVFATGCGKKTTPAPVGSEPVVQETVPYSTPEDDPNVQTPESLPDDVVSVTPTEPQITEPEGEVLDTDSMYICDMYAVSDISVYEEPVEGGSVIATVAKGGKVSVLGILHEAQFYKVSYETFEGYVRLVDLEDENGLYDEITNQERLENSEQTKVEEQVQPPTQPQEIVSQETETSRQFDALMEQALSQYTMEELIEMQKEYERQVQEKYDAEVAEYIHDPSKDGNYVFGQGDYSDIPAHIVQ